MVEPNHPKPVYPPNWWSIAQAVKQDHNWTCEICHIRHGDNPRNNITVHHRDHNTFNNEPSNLSVLCQACHLREERKYRSRLRADRLFNEFQASGQLIFEPYKHLLFPQLNRACYEAPIYKREPAS